MSQFKEQIW